MITAFYIKINIMYVIGNQIVNKYKFLNICPNKNNK